MLSIVSWNVNSIKARLANVTEWLREEQPDVVCLQELKCQDENFPRLEIEDLGYNVETVGQKSYNGVAMLSRFPLEDVVKGLPGNEEDEQARYIEALVLADKPVRVGGLYLPNGNPAPGPKYDYKLDWMGKLKTHASDLLKAEESVILCGDYNIIPRAEDCWEETVWADDALALPQSRAALTPAISPCAAASSYPVVPLICPARKSRATRRVSSEGASSRGSTKSYSMA